MAKGFGQQSENQVDSKVLAVSAFLASHDPDRKLFLSCGRLDEWTVAIVVSDAWLLATRRERQEFMLAIGKSYIKAFEGSTKAKAKLAVVSSDASKVYAGYDDLRGAYFVEAS